MMRWTDFLDVGAIRTDLTARGGTQVVHELAGLLARGAAVPREKLSACLLARERLGSTAAGGGGVAIPHCRLEGAARIVTCLGLHREGVAFGDPEDGVVRIFVGLVSPPDTAGLHLNVLARVAALLRDARLRAALLQASTAEEARELLVRAETAHLGAARRTPWVAGTMIPSNSVPAGPAH